MTDLERELKFEVEYRHRVEAELAEQRKRAEQAEAALVREGKDAERYRWLREHEDWDSPIVKLGYDEYETAHGEELDAAVDAAIAAAPEGK